MSLVRKVFLVKVKTGEEVKMFMSESVNREEQLHSRSESDFQTFLKSPFTVKLLQYTI